MRIELSILRRRHLSSKGHLRLPLHLRENQTSCSNCAYEVNDPQVKNAGRSNSSWEVLEGLFLPCIPLGLMPLMW